MTQPSLTGTAEPPCWVSRGIPIAFAVLTAAIGLFWPGAVRIWFGGELGLMENLEALALLAALIVGLRAAFSVEIRADRFKTAWVWVFVLGCFYVLGEEISWGQHYFGWGTPEWYREINDQQETNLHNTSDWLDQKPRTLLELAIYFSALFYPLLRRVWRPAMFERLPAWTWPTRVCQPAAILTLLVQLLDKSPLGVSSAGIGLRLSEVREFFVYYFLFIYIYSLYRRRDMLPS